MDDLFSYGGRGPGASNATTSRAAAESMAPHTSRVAQTILDAIGETMDQVDPCRRGMTAAQVEAATAFRAQTVTGRIRELVLAGKLVQSNRTRPTPRGRCAIVWEIAPPGTVPPPTGQAAADERKAALALHRAFASVPAGWHISHLGQSPSEYFWECRLAQGGEAATIMKIRRTAREAIGAAVDEAKARQQ